MINSITIKNHIGESITINMRSPEQSGFFIKKIEGLGPSKANINMSESLGIDGSRYNSARQEYRNIVFGLGFLEKESIEESRQRSYRFFPIKKEIEITINTDLRVVKTTGYVESNEPDIFSKSEDTIISVVCPDPFFHNLFYSIVTFSNSSANFSFPFSNESLVNPLIEFGIINSSAQSTLIYTGDSPVGIIMEIHATGIVGTLSIYNLRTRESMIIDSDILTELTGSGLMLGDRVVISTLKGNKSVTLYRDGEEINILNALGPESIWFTLEPGDNTFYYSAESGGSNINFTILHDVLYDGV